MNQIEKLKRVKKVIQHGEMTQLSELSGVHVSVISNYLKNGHRMVLNRANLNKILNAWDKIEDNKFRDYDK